MISPKLNVSAVVGGLVKGTIPLQRRYAELLVELVASGQFRYRSIHKNHLPPLYQLRSETFLRTVCPRTKSLSGSQPGTVSCGGIYYEL
jgi:hypothetical protein